MKILLLHQYYLEKNDGGGSRFNEMTKSWVEEGHEVTVLAGMVHYNTGKKANKYKGKYFYKDNFDRGITVWRCHVSEAYNVNFIGRLWAYFSFVFSSTWAGLFKVKGKYDAVVVTSPPLFVGITAYVLAKLKGLPFVFEIRDLWPESAIDTGVLKNGLIIKMAYAFEKFIYKKADKINVLTPAFRKTLIDVKKVGKEKVAYIPNAADFSLSESLLQSFNAEKFKEELGLKNNFVITYVGAHGVANHLIQLIDAAELLKDTPVVFQLIGSGMEKEMLQNEVNKRGLSNVIFRDTVPKAEVFKYILASNMGASVLKRVDTFKTIYSNKTFDYMACKKPILMGIEGISKELIKEAGCGICIEPENAQDYNEKIRAFMEEKTSQEIGEKGYLYARSNFDRGVLAKKYLKLLEEL